MSYTGRIGVSYAQGMRMSGASEAGASSATEAVPTGAALTMIRKNKIKEVEQLRKAMEVDPKSAPALERLTKFMQTRSIAGMDYFMGKHEDFFEAMSNRHITLNVAAEYNKKSETGFIMGIPGPEIMGGVLRDSGAKCIIVAMDKRTGGTAVNEFARFIREQQRAHSFNPGPIPVVWHEFVVDFLQIDYAAANGAAAITLSPEVNHGDVSEQIAYCKTVNIEPLVMCRSKNDIDMALSGGARCLVLHGMDEKAQIKLRDQYPATHAGAFPTVLWGARLRATSEFSGIEEIDASWALRDAGFNFVWPTCDSLYCMGMVDVYSTVQAMKSKAAKDFISPRQFMMDRKKEGAKEHLGDLAM